MDEMKYARLTEVLGRWKAEIVESLLQSEGMDVVLVQELYFTVSLFQSIRSRSDFRPERKSRSGAGVGQGFGRSLTGDAARLMKRRMKVIQTKAINPHKPAVPTFAENREAFYATTANRG